MTAIGKPQLLLSDAIKLLHNLLGSGNIASAEAIWMRHFTTTCADSDRSGDYGNNNIFSHCICSG